MRGLRPGSKRSDHGAVISLKDLRNMLDVLAAVCGATERKVTGADTKAANRFWPMRCQQAHLISE